MFQIRLHFFSLIYECDKLIYSPLPQQTLAGRRAKKCGKRKKRGTRVLMSRVSLFLIGWKATTDFFSVIPDCMKEMLSSFDIPDWLKSDKGLFLEWQNRPQTVIRLNSGLWIWPRCVEQKSSVSWHSQLTIAALRVWPIIFNRTTLVKYYTFLSRLFK